LCHCIDLFCSIVLCEKHLTAFVCIDDARRAYHGGVKATSVEQSLCGEVTARFVHYQIRRSVGTDAARLNASMHSSATYQGQYSGIWDGYSVTEEQICSDLVYLAENDGRLVGFYSLTRIVEAPELDLLFVDDAFHGKGVGGLLMRHLQETARALGIRKIKIVAHPPAEGFYLRSGAQRIGTQEPTGRVSWSRPLLELVID
jgi:GNAT superfamily N-acetyltransferase